ncbi:hypothetical protein ABBQ32_011052 [Trebouxia sp. C0010 RCD-2024]
MDSLLSDLAAAYTSLPSESLLVGHCLLVSSWYRGFRERYLLCYWIGICAAFGGGIVSSLLLQDPVQAPIAFFSSNYLGIVWSICWWLINYCPGDIVASTHALLPFKMLTKVCLNILRAGQIASRVNLSVQKFPGVIAAPLLIGTLAGCGGKLLQDGVQMACGTLPGPSEVSSPGFASRTAFAGALVYYLSVHALEVLKPAEGLALVTTVFVVHGLCSDLLRQPLDWTHPLAVLAHKIANVPMPSAQGGVKKPQSKAALPAKSSTQSSTDKKKDK